MFDRGETPFVRSARHQALTGVYTIDPDHSTIGFSVRHTMVANVRGKFTAFEGLLKLDGSRPTRSEAYLSVQTGSFDTGSPERDTHVTGPDFLDSVTFPVMSFRSSGIVEAGGEQFRMAGFLPIKDIELPVHLDLEFGGQSRDTRGKQRIGFTGTADLRRSDWGLDWNTTLATGGVLVSDKVKLHLDISAVRADRAEAP